MGTIREDFVLNDQFSSAFSSFLSLGNQSVIKMTEISVSTNAVNSSIQSLGAQVSSVNSSIQAQTAQIAQSLNNLNTSVQNQTAQMGQSFQNMVNGMSSAFSVATGAMIGGMSNLSQRIDYVASSINYQTYQIVDGFRNVQRTIQETNSQGFDRLEAALAQINRSVQSTRTSMRGFSGEVSGASAQAGNLKNIMSQVKGIVAGLSVALLTKGLINASDSMIQIQARLNRLSQNDLVAEGFDAAVGSQEMLNAASLKTAESQEMIFQAAQRTGVLYNEMASFVSKVGNNAKDAFSGSEEVIAFTELLNKQYAIAGATQMEISSASLQLTQALGSGVLRGQELNAVFNAAPGVIQSIADYMGVPIGKIREMAADGEITAEIVKNAMFAAADSINTQFEQIPLTFGAAFNQVKNAGTMAFQGVYQKLNDFLNSDTGQAFIGGLIKGMEMLASVASFVIDLLIMGAEWIASNWDIVSSVLIGVAVVLGLVLVSSAIAAFAAWISVAWPFVLIAGVIAFAIYKAREAGITFEEIGSKVGSVFGWLYSVIYNIVADVWNVWAVFAEFFANIFNDPVTAIKRLFWDLGDTVLGIVESAAEAIDALLGTNISGAVSNLRQTVMDFVNETIGDNAIKIERMEKLDVQETMDKFGDFGGNVGEALDNFNLDEITSVTDGFGDSLGGFGLGAGNNIGDVGKVGSVGEIKKDVNLADEDIKMFQELAERKYVNSVNLQTLRPEINVTVSGGSSDQSDAENIAHVIENLLLQQSSSHTANSYQMP